MEVNLIFIISCFALTGVGILNLKLMNMKLFKEDKNGECYVQSSIEFRVLKLEFRALTE